MSLITAAVVAVVVVLASWLSFRLGQAVEFARAEMLEGAGWAESQAILDLSWPRVLVAYARSY